MQSTNLTQDVAVILAAGVGRRLGEGGSAPKILLEFGGRTLLERHLRNLEAVGVRHVAMTLGHQAEAVRRAATRVETSIEIEFVENPRYRQGSLLSLWTQREVLGAGVDVILMDADVLCDARMVGRLADGPEPGVLLVDREIEPGDEPVKLCFRREEGAERIVDFRKRPEHAHDWHGESVGFFRFSAALAGELARTCDHYVAAGRPELEYEEAIRDLILVAPERFGAVDVSDLPWTEIDFPQDVERARTAILPQLER